MVNGTAVKFPDQKPVVQNERTLALLCVVAETLDCSVDWISETNAVLVNAKKNGRELSIYERLKQTGLYYDLKDNRDSEHTRFLVKKTLVKAGADLTNTDPIKLGAGWWIDAPNILDPSQYPDFDCGIVVADYNKATRDQVEKVYEILYPTGHKEVSALMLKMLRGEIWETYMEWFPGSMGIKPGTAGCRYIDGREVNMRVDGNQHRMYMQVNTVGHVNPDKPKVLDAKTVKGLTRDY